MSPARNSLLALLLLVPVPSFGVAAAFFWWPDTAAGKAMFMLSKIWLAVLPLAWLKLVDRGQISWSPARNGGFAIATVLGVAIAGIIMAAYAVVSRTGLLNAELISARAAMTGLDNRTTFILGALYWITLNSLMEEYVWRWFVFRKLEALIGGKAAVVAAALGFTAHHVVALAAQFNWQITLLASTGVLVGGATWTWLYLRYRSVWPCYVSHAFADIAIFVIGYRLIFL